MNKSLVLSILVIFLATGCASANSSESDVKLIEKAEALYSSGDYLAAMTIILPLAQRGNADAEFAVGLLTFRGAADDGKLSDLQRQRNAWGWIRKAAIHGNEEAIMHVADTFKNGWYHFPRNEAVSTSWRLALKTKSKIQEALTLEKTALPSGWELMPANGDERSDKK